MPAGPAAPASFSTNKDIRALKAAVEASPPAVRMIGRSDCLVWGLSSTERLRRTVRGLGITDVQDAAAPLPTEGEVVLVRADYAIEDRLIRSLIAHEPGVVLTSEDGADGAAGGVPVAAKVEAADAPKTAALLAGGDAGLPGDLLVRGPIGLGSAYNRKLRKREAPYVLPLNDASTGPIENRIFAGAYKGITDFITKYAWPLAARWVTRQAVRLGVTPNQVTALGFVLVFVAAWLFMQGHFLAGLAVGYFMTFLDTVDGKLARVTLTSSWWGNIFDHGTDLIHPPFWYAAWWYGLYATGAAAGVPYLDAALWIVVVGYVVGRLEEGLFIKLFGIQIHIWRPVDSFFRLITARRNPNIAILTVAALFGAPAEGFLLIAGWTIFSLLFHAVRILQAALEPGDGLRSWLAEPPSP
jgi:phosphatidylglycerophosphate synthase